MSSAHEARGEGWDEAVLVWNGNVARVHTPADEKRVRGRRPDPRARLGRGQADAAGKAPAAGMLDDGLGVPSQPHDAVKRLRPRRAH
jgi:hypothetical protein